jgi:hypothetical protein
MPWQNNVTKFMPEGEALSPFMRIVLAQKHLRSFAAQAYCYRIAVMRPCHTLDIAVLVSESMHIDRRAEIKSIDDSRGTMNCRVLGRWQ